MLIYYYIGIGAHLKGTEGTLSSPPPPPAPQKTRHRGLYGNIKCDLKEMNRSWFYCLKSEKCINN